MPPESIEYVRDVIEKSLGHPLSEVFDYFEDTPLGSASIGQVCVYACVYACMHVCMHTMQKWYSISL